MNADVAQLVAHHLAKVRVASSSLVIRSKVHLVEPRFTKVGHIRQTLPWWNG